MLKGLILKDLYNVRFQIIAGFLIMLFPTAELILIACTAAEGSDSIVIEPNVFGLFICGAINYLTIVLSSSFLVNTVNDDFKSGWAKMQGAMPLSHREIIGAKMVTNALVLAGLTVFSVVVNLIMVALVGLNPGIMIAVPIVLSLLQFLTLLVPTIIGYRNEGRFVTPVYIGAVLVVAGIIAVFLYAVSS